MLIVSVKIGCSTICCEPYMFLACLLAVVLAYSLPNTFVFMVMLLFVCLVPQCQAYLLQRLWFEHDNTMETNKVSYPVFKKMYHDTRGKLFLQRLLPGKYCCNFST